MGRNKGKQKQRKVERAKNRSYLGCWSNWRSIGFSGLPKIEPRFVFGYYDMDGYEGRALLITSHNGRTFKVTEDSHCSCGGLSDCDYDNTSHGVRSLHKFMQAPYGAWHENRALIEKWLKHIKPKPPSRRTTTHVHMDFEARSGHPPLHEDCYPNQDTLLTITQDGDRKTLLLTPKFTVRWPHVKLPTKEYT